MENYESAKDRQKYISKSHKGYDKIKLAIYDYVSGLTSAVNDYLRNGYKWQAVTKYLDNAFYSKYATVDKADLYRTVTKDYLKNVHNINVDNIDDYIGSTIVNEGYMSCSKTLINPWGGSWFSDEVILHIYSNNKVTYLDIDKIFENDELPSGEQEEILLQRKTRLRIIGSYRQFDEGLPPGHYEKFSPDGSLVIQCTIN